MTSYLDRLKETQNLKTSNVATAKTAKSLLAVKTVPSSDVSENSATLLAVKTVPSTGNSENSSGRLHANDETVPRWTVARQELVKRWLEHISETHPDIIREVIDRCRDNPDARAFFIGRAERELPKPDAPGTTRVTVETRTAACDVAVPADRVIDYTLTDREGIGIVLPEPGETIEEAAAKLRERFGDRITFVRPGDTAEGSL